MALIIAGGLAFISFLLLPGISLMTISPRMPKPPVRNPALEYKISDGTEKLALTFDNPEFPKELVETNISLPYEDCRESRRTHVLDKYATQLSGHVSHALKNVVYASDSFCRVAGVVVNANVTETRSGAMLSGYLNDPSGTAEFILFADKYAVYPVKLGDIIYVVGKINGSKLIVNNLDILGKKRIRPKKCIEECEAI